VRTARRMKLLEIFRPAASQIRTDSRVILGGLDLFTLAHNPAAKGHNYSMAVCDFRFGYRIQFGRGVCTWTGGTL
jgi:hypothetical protein